jgi:hypothetical protein
LGGGGHPNFIEEPVSTVTSIHPYPAPFLNKNHVAALVNMLADAITIENLPTQMYQNLRLTLFFLEDPFP